MGVYGGPNVVENGLVLALDVGNSKSYPGSGTAWTDLSGNGNTGTLVNGVGYNSGNLGSLSFDGVDDYVSIPYIGNTSNSYTFFITMKSDNMTDNTTNRQTIFGLSQDQNPAFRHFDLEIWGNTGIGFRGDGGSTQGVNFFSYTWNFDKNANDINYYVVTITSTNHKISLNGSLKDTINQSSTSSFNSIILGSRIFTGGNAWNGGCYNFYMYDRELTASEIQQNFIATKSRFGL
jgi:hypothetical protein